jgi:hypothetical protein
VVKRLSCTMSSIRYCVYFAAVAAVLLVDVVSGLGCPICRSYDRPLLNPSHQFTMRNGQGQTADWTCGFLEESVADVNPANEGEGFFCALAQVSMRRLTEWGSSCVIYGHHGHVILHFLTFHFSCTVLTRLGQSVNVNAEDPRLHPSKT